MQCCQCCRSQLLHCILQVQSDITARSVTVLVSANFIVSLCWALCWTAYPPRCIVMVCCMYGLKQVIHRANLICRVQAGFAFVSPALIPWQKSQGNLSQRLNRFWPTVLACQLGHSAAFPGTNRTPAQVRDAHCINCRLQQSCRKIGIQERQLCTTFAQELKVDHESDMQKLPKVGIWFYCS